MSRSRPLLFPAAPRPLVLAHRGCSTIAPENTLSAFVAAHERGVPGIELDIHQCATGELVVIHDDDLARTSDGRGPVEKHTLAALSKLDAGSWFAPSFAGEPIPTLDAVFERFGRELYYDVEIKARRHLAPLVPRLVSTIRRYGLVDRCIVSSFNPLALLAVRRVAPALPTAVIWADFESLPFYLRHGEGRWLSGCSVLKPHHEKVTRLSVLFARALGLPVLPWVIEDQAQAERLLGWGGAGVIAKAPHLLELLPRNDKSRGSVQQDR